MKILYVEDNKINALVMNKMLSKKNANVRIAYNGKDALDIVAKDKPDLILLDINLGKDQMDGCELLQHLRKIETIHNTPVFAVTAYALPHDKERFLNIGFDQYFSKPVNFQKLFSEIQKLNLHAS